MCIYVIIVAPAAHIASGSVYIEKKLIGDINPEGEVCEVVINKIIQVLLPPCVARAL